MKSLFDHRFFKDKHGTIVLAQAPNAPMVIFFVAFVISRLVSDGYWHDFTTGATQGALLVWGILELTRGVNGFRRSLGALGIVLAVTASVTGYNA